MNPASPLHVLVLGASYGLLPALRLSMAGHLVTVVGRDAETRAMTERGASVRFADASVSPWQVPARKGWAQCPGELGVAGPDVDPSAVDLVVLAMSEPQCAAPDIAALLRRVGRAERPVLALLNMLPASFVRRLAPFDVTALRPAYAAWSVWDDLDPSLMTAASPDPQALRLSADQPEALTVTWPANFKVAPFARPVHQDLLCRLSQDMKASAAASGMPHLRWVTHRSLHVPLAKWPMLMAGNCRSADAAGAPRTIAQAVCDDPDASRRVYEQAAAVVRAMGGDGSEVVPFTHYLAAAAHLSRPSSLARALAAGATMVERVDLMVALSGQALGCATDELDAVVQQVEAAVARNRASGSQ